jgi:hypothetical protein
MAVTVLAAMALVLAPVVGLGRAQAQVVQLPTVQSFGMTGAVSVPDQGTAVIAGNRRLRTGSTTRGVGPLASRSATSQAGGTSVSVSVDVIDLQAMDQAILDQASIDTAQMAANYNARGTGTPVVNTLTPHLYAQRVERKPIRSVDPNAWQIALGDPGSASIGVANAMVNDDSEVRFYMLRAHEALSAGHTAAAKVYYRLAYQRLTPAQQARLQQVQQAADEAAAKAAGKDTNATENQQVTTPAQP